MYEFFFSVAVLNNSAAVVAVPESQLFTVPQPHPVDVIQHESDMPTDENVSSMVPNVNDVHVTLSINVDPNSASLNGGGVLTDATQTASTTTTDSKACILVDFTICTFTHRHRTQLMIYWYLALSFFVIIDVAEYGLG